MIHPLADVQSVNVGPDTRIWQFTVVLPGARIGERCNLCSHVFIENDVVIGNAVTIKNGVQIWDGMRVEDRVFIGPNVTFTNDKAPRSKKYPAMFDTTLIREGASIGANATIIGGRQIGRYAMIGAGSIVTKDVGDYQLWYGSPARHRGYVTRTAELLNLQLVCTRTRMQFHVVDGDLVPR